MLGRQGEDDYKRRPQNKIGMHANLRSLSTNLSFYNHRKGIILSPKMIPEDVMDEYREQARDTILKGKPVNRTAAIVVIGIWVGLAIFAIGIVSKHLLPEGMGVSGILSVGFFENGNPNPK